MKITISQLKEAVKGIAKSILQEQLYTKLPNILLQRISPMLLQGENFKIQGNDLVGTLLIGNGIILPIKIVIQVNGEPTKVE